MDRECMEFDVVIVGAGPAGLAAACQLALLNKQTPPLKDEDQSTENPHENAPLSICVIDKGAEVGAHILSGAVFETTALDELFPEWPQMSAPVSSQVTKDQFLYLTTHQNHVVIPHVLTPNPMLNDKNDHKNYVISLADLCRWLAIQAEELGVEIFPGFAASSISYDHDGRVSGVITSDMGLDKTNQQKPSFEAGIELKAKYTLFAEGARGHLGKELINRFQLDRETQPQHYALGIKEIWEIPSEYHEEGKVIHATGWPLSETNTCGGSFLYHLADNQIAIGLITDLNYQNPYLSPYDEFQRLKHHPSFSRYLKSGQRIAYGARAIAKGGLSSLPKQEFPGGILIGCDAGTLNVAKIKGSHTAMKSGMLAAQAVFDELNSNEPQSEPNYQKHFKQSWLYDELKDTRNFGSGIHKFGHVLGGLLASFEHNIWSSMTKKPVPWTIKDQKYDHDTLHQTNQSYKIDYPKPDGILSFDKASSLFLSGTQHEENQPCHLQLIDQNIPIELHLDLYDEPSQRYCPAGVYEFIREEIKGEEDRQVTNFQINAANCLHCKTCDIKDPSQNIKWQPPEGGGGPNYQNM